VVQLTQISIAWCSKFTFFTSFLKLWGTSRKMKNSVYKHVLCDPGLQHVRAYQERYTKDNWLLFTYIQRERCSYNWWDCVLDRLHTKTGESLFSVLWKTWSKPVCCSLKRPGMTCCLFSEIPRVCLMTVFWRTWSESVISSLIDLE